MTNFFFMYLFNTSCYINNWVRPEVVQFIKHFVLQNNKMFDELKMLYLPEVFLCLYTVERSFKISIIFICPLLKQLLLIRTISYLNNSLTTWRLPFVVIKPQIFCLNSYIQSIQYDFCNRHISKMFFILLNTVQSH